MTTTTKEERLAEIRRRIDRLRASGLERHEVEEKLGLLSARLDVAEHSLATDASRDWASFAAAVEAELRSWDIYLERLQTSVAAKAWRPREQAEAAISEVRSRRIAVDNCLAQAGGDASHDARARVVDARDTLERLADELSAEIE